MPNFIGLYYPFIHFKDEAWLKTVALYWDGVRRIVPREYTLHDSDTVKKLAGSGLIENEPPAPNDEWPVRDPFVQFLLSNSEQLRDRYGVAHRADWPHDPISARWAPDGSDMRLAYVHIEKIWPELKDALVDTGLADVGQARDERWVGMHPKLADVYMTALAEHMAAGRGWYPITDETLDQLAVSGFSIERLSRALLDDKGLAANTPLQHEITTGLANVCLESVIPEDVANVPVEKIIQLRKDHQTEFKAFQDHLAAFRAQATNLSGVTDRKAFAEHLQLHYTKEVKPSLDEVRRAFKLADLRTATSIVNVNAAVPMLVSSLATGLGLAINPILGGVASFAFGVIPVIQKKRDDVEAARSKPGAWLLRVEEGLKPQDFLSWVYQGVRKFAIGA